MTFDARRSDLSETGVYTFAGHIVERGGGGDAAAERTGLAIALSHDQVIAQMAEWGFRVTAVSALHEVRSTLAVLEAIAAGADDVEPADFLNFLVCHPPYAADQVFSFGGQRTGTATFLAGFAVARDLAALTDEMSKVGFQLQTSSSLAELRELADEMASVQEGDENAIDLVGLSIAA